MRYLILRDLMRLNLDLFKIEFQNLYYVKDFFITILNVKIKKNLLTINHVIQ